MIEYFTSIDKIEPKHLEGFFVGWRAPLTQEQHFQTLKNSQYVVLAYDTEISKVVGFINALCDQISFAFIPMIEVWPEYQSMGIGSELMNRMFQQLEHIACIDLMCDVHMQSYYERFGMLKSHGMLIRK